MLKRLAILVFLGALSLGWPSVAENQQSHPNAHQNKPSKTEDIVPPTHVVIDSSSATFHTKPEADENKKTSEEEPLPRFERPEWVAVYITAIYVLIAAVTLMVIWRQANIMKTQSDHMGQQVSLMKSQTLVLQESVTAIEKQVDEMKTQTAVAKTSAENALLNTKALIASERAWIVESVESPSSNQFNFVITNVGRTPANVRSVWIAPIITERGEKPEIPTDEKTRELLLGFSVILHKCVRILSANERFEWPINKEHHGINTPIGLEAYLLHNTQLSVILHKSGPSTAPRPGRIGNCHRCLRR
jgi:hypothetical protein